MVKGAEGDWSDISERGSCSDRAHAGKQREEEEVLVCRNKDSG